MAGGRDAERFDVTRKVRFETFAARAVRGAILDYLRKIDPLKRTVRRQVTSLTDATQELRQQLGRSPSDDELCERLNISRRQLRQHATQRNDAIEVFLRQQ